MNTKDDVVFVPLTRGKVAVVDAADWPLVSRYTWFAMPASNYVTWYARAVVPKTVPLAPKKTVALHILLLGAIEGMQIDHIDGDGLNNRRSNLRHATRAQNRHNSSPNRHTSHGLKGVDFQKHRGNWRARIYVSGVYYSLGVFETSEEAGRAYDEAARRYFGAFARLNFPD